MCVGLCCIEMPWDRSGHETGDMRPGREIGAGGHASAAVRELWRYGELEAKAWHCQSRHGEPPASIAVVTMHARVWLCNHIRASTGEAAVMYISCSDGC